MNGRAGKGSSVSDGGSDMPDRAVVPCVVRAFGGLSFPAPEGGRGECELSDLVRAWRLTVDFARAEVDDADHTRAMTDKRVYCWRYDDAGQAGKVEGGGLVPVGVAMPRGARKVPAGRRTRGFTAPGASLC